MHNNIINIISPLKVNKDKKDQIITNLNIVSAKSMTNSQVQTKENSEGQFEEQIERQTEVNAEMQAERCIERQTEAQIREQAEGQIKIQFKAQAKMQAEAQIRKHYQEKTERKIEKQTEGWIERQADRQAEARSRAHINNVNNANYLKINTWGQIKDQVKDQVKNQTTLIQDAIKNQAKAKTKGLISLCKFNKLGAFARMMLLGATMNFSGYSISNAVVNTITAPLDYDLIYLNTYQMTDSAIVDGFGVINPYGTYITTREVNGVLETISIEEPMTFTANGIHFRVSLLDGAPKSNLTVDSALPSRDVQSTGFAKDVNTDYVAFTRASGINLINSNNRSYVSGMAFDKIYTFVNDNIFSTNINLNSNISSNGVDFAAMSFESNNNAHTFHSINNLENKLNVDSSIGSLYDKNLFGLFVNHNITISNNLTFNNLSSIDNNITIDNVNPLNLSSNNIIGLYTYNASPQGLITFNAPNSGTNNIINNKIIFNKNLSWASNNNFIYGILNDSANSSINPNKITYKLGVDNIITLPGIDTVDITGTKNGTYNAASVHSVKNIITITGADHGSVNNSNITGTFGGIYNIPVENEININGGVNIEGSSSVSSVIGSRSGFLTFPTDNDEYKKSVKNTINITGEIFSNVKIQGSSGGNYTSSLENSLTFGATQNQGVQTVLNISALYNDNNFLGAYNGSVTNTMEFNRIGDNSTVAVMNNAQTSSSLTFNGIITNNVTILGDPIGSTDAEKSPLGTSANLIVIRNEADNIYNEAVNNTVTVKENLTSGAIYMTGRINPTDNSIAPDLAKYNKPVNNTIKLLDDTNTANLGYKNLTGSKIVGSFGGTYNANAKLTNEITAGEISSSSIYGSDSGTYNDEVQNIITLGEVGNYKNMNNSSIYGAYFENFGSYKDNLTNTINVGNVTDNSTIIGSYSIDHSGSASDKIVKNIIEVGNITIDTTNPKVYGSWNGNYKNLENSITFGTTTDRTAQTILNISAFYNDDLTIGIYNGSVKNEIKGNYLGNNSTLYVMNNAQTAALIFSGSVTNDLTLDGVGTNVYIYAINNAASNTYNGIVNNTIQIKSDFTQGIIQSATLNTSNDTSTYNGAVTNTIKLVDDNLNYKNLTGSIYGSWGGTYNANAKLTNKITAGEISSSSIYGSASGTYNDEVQNTITLGDATGGYKNLRDSTIRGSYGGTFKDNLTNTINTGNVIGSSVIIGSGDIDHSSSAVDKVVKNIIEVGNISVTSTDNPKVYGSWNGKYQNLENSITFGTTSDRTAQTILNISALFNNDDNPGTYGGSVTNTMEFNRIGDNSTVAVMNNAQTSSLLTFNGIITNNVTILGDPIGSTDAEKSPLGTSANLIVIRNEADNIYNEAVNNTVTVKENLAGGAIYMTGAINPTDNSIAPDLAKYNKPVNNTIMLGDATGGYKNLTGSTIRGSWGGTFNAGAKLTNEITVGEMSNSLIRGSVLGTYNDEVQNTITLGNMNSSEIHGSWEGTYSKAVTNTITLDSISSGKIIGFYATDIAGNPNAIIKNTITVNNNVNQAAGKTVIIDTNAFSSNTDPNTIFRSQFTKKLENTITIKGTTTGGTFYTTNKYDSYANDVDNQIIFERDVISVNKIIGFENNDNSKDTAMQTANYKNINVKIEQLSPMTATQHDIDAVKISPYMPAFTPPANGIYNRNSIANLNNDPNIKTFDSITSRVNNLLIQNNKGAINFSSFTVTDPATQLPVSRVLNNITASASPDTDGNNQAAIVINHSLIFGSGIDTSEGLNKIIAESGDIVAGTNSANLPLFIDIMGEIYAQGGSIDLSVKNITINGDIKATKNIKISAEYALLDIDSSFRSQRLTGVIELSSHNNTSIEDLKDITPSSGISEIKFKDAVISEVHDIEFFGPWLIGSRVNNDVINFADINVFDKQYGASAKTANGLLNLQGFSDANISARNKDVEIANLHFTTSTGGSQILNLDANTTTSKKIDIKHFYTDITDPININIKGNINIGFNLTGTLGINNLNFVYDEPNKTNLTLNIFDSSNITINTNAIVISKKQEAPTASEFSLNDANDINNELGSAAAPQATPQETAAINPQDVLSSLTFTANVVDVMNMDNDLTSNSAIDKINFQFIDQRDNNPTVNLNTINYTANYILPVDDNKYFLTISDQTILNPASSAVGAKVKIGFLDPNTDLLIPIMHQRWKQVTASKVDTNVEVFTSDFILPNNGQILGYVNADNATTQGVSGISGELKIEDTLTLNGNMNISGAVATENMMINYSPCTLSNPSSLAVNNTLTLKEDLNIINDDTRSSSIVINKIIQNNKAITINSTGKTTDDENITHNITLNAGGGPINPEDPVTLITISSVIMNGSNTTGNSNINNHIYLHYSTITNITNNNPDSFLSAINSKIINPIFNNGGGLTLLASTMEGGTFNNVNLEARDSSIVDARITNGSLILTNSQATNLTFNSTSPDNAIDAKSNIENLTIPNDAGAGASFTLQFTADTDNAIARMKNITTNNKTFTLDISITDDVDYHAGEVNYTANKQANDKRYLLSEKIDGKDTNITATSFDNIVINQASSNSTLTNLIDTYYQVDAQTGKHYLAFVANMTRAVHREILNENVIIITPTPPTPGPTPPTPGPTPPTPGPTPGPTPNPNPENGGGTIINPPPTTPPSGPGIITVNPSNPIYTPIPVPLAPTVPNPGSIDTVVANNAINNAAIIQSTPSAVEAILEEIIENKDIVISLNKTLGVPISNDGSASVSASPDDASVTENSLSQKPLDVFSNNIQSTVQKSTSMQNESKSLQKQQTNEVTKNIGKENIQDYDSDVNSNNSTSIEASGSDSADVVKKNMLFQTFIGKGYTDQDKNVSKSEKTFVGGTIFYTNKINDTLYGSLGGYFAYIGTTFEGGIKDQDSSKLFHWSALSSITYIPNEKFYIIGSVTGSKAYGSYKRKIRKTSSNDSYATADFEYMGLDFDILASYRISVRDNIKILPQVGVSYSHIWVDKHREKGVIGIEFKEKDTGNFSGYAGIRTDISHNNTLYTLDLGANYNFTEASEDKFGKLVDIQENGKVIPLSSEYNLKFKDPNLGKLKVSATVQIVQYLNNGQFISVGVKGSVTGPEKTIELQLGAGLDM